jgi:SRSO17 transposase
MICYQKQFPFQERPNPRKYPMFILQRFPFFGKRHFKQIRKQLGCCSFNHLWRCVLAIASLHGKKSLSKFNQFFGEKKTRQAIAHFLTHAEWDAPELLLENALTTLRRLGWKSGDSLYLILDDTQKAKRAKKMDAVSRIFLHAEKRYANGHTIVGCAINYRNVIIPCGVKLWASKDYCTLSQKNNKHEPVEFQKLTDIAADFVTTFRLPTAGHVTVLFDKFYLCGAVVTACREKGYEYIGAVKSNRNFFPDGRPRDKRKLESFGKNVLEKEGKRKKIEGCKKRHTLAEKVGTMTKLGRVKLAFSQRTREKSWIILATNQLEWTAKDIVVHYRNRWSIEVLFKMSKQHLGLGDYQYLRYTAVDRYLHLVLLAYHLLTHLALERSSEKIKLHGCDAFRLPSVEQMQAMLRRMLVEDGIAHLTSRKDKKLQRKFQRLFLTNV